jgi:hypothetical protein
MKMMHDYGKFLLAAAFVGALVGCNDKEAPPPQLAPAPKMEASRAEPAEPALKAENLERSQIDAQAPFVLTLDTPADYNKPGEIEVKAQIDAPHTIDAPTAIAVSFPHGVQLVEGNKREQLADLPGGITTRTFRFKLTKGLTEHAPIKVTVDMKHPGGAFGAHAERVFPKKVVQTPIKASNVPKPPIGRPGAGGLVAPAGQRAIPTR